MDTMNYIPRLVNKIILHCSDSPNGVKHTVAECDQWHRDRGFQRNMERWGDFNPSLLAVGYHYWLNTDGRVETGRNLDEVGAHCSGLNSNSVGICLVGKDKFSKAQWAALHDLIENLKILYPQVKIIGHCNTPSGVSQGKTCPNFDVTEYVKRGLQPEEAHIA